MSPLSYNPLTGKFSSPNGSSEATQVMPIELRLENGCIEWRLDSSGDWIQLCQLSDFISSEVARYLSQNQLLLDQLSSDDYVRKTELSSVALTGCYQNLEGTPKLGSASSLNASVIKDANKDEVVTGSDTRLIDAREWNAKTVSDEELEDQSNDERRAWSVQKVWKTMTAWWNNSRDKVKLEQIADGATANQSDAFLLNRVNHTGAQPATTITGLSKVAITGVYNHLSGRPVLGEAAKLNIGTTANSVAAGNDERFICLQKNLDGVSSILDALQININKNGSIQFGADLFGYNSTTRDLTLSADSLRLKGLHFLPAFSRDHGQTSCGVPLFEISNDVNLVSSTGKTDQNTTPTQHAVKTYLGQYYARDIKSYDDSLLSLYTTTHEDKEGYQYQKQSLELKTNQANGLAQLNSEGLIPSFLLPSYIDDVLEFVSLDKFPSVGEISFIYIAVDTKLSYRWSGSTYVEIPSSYGTTDQIVEGSLNKYCTPERVRQSISVGGSLEYDPLIGNIYYSTPTSDGIKEGVDHLYFTSERVYECLSVGLNSGLTFNRKTGVIDRAPLTEEQITQTRQELKLDTKDIATFGGLNLINTNPNKPGLMLVGSEFTHYSEVTPRNNRCIINTLADNHFCLNVPINKSIAFDLGGLDELGDSFCWSGYLLFEYVSGAINWFESSTSYQVKWVNKQENSPMVSQGLNQLQIKVYGGKKLICLSVL